MSPGEPRRSVPPAVAPQQREARQRSLRGLVAGGALLGIACAGSWLGQRQLDKFLLQLDSDALGMARAIVDRSLEQDHDHVLSQVALLADDNRIRSTVIMAELDEATIRDVLTDLKKASGASLLAVLDPSAKVRAVVGVEGLRQVDLSRSAVVKEAAEHPASYVWTLPREAMTVGVAPIRTRGIIHAFLVLGMQTVKHVLTAPKGVPGVAGAIVIRDNITSASSEDPEVLHALRIAASSDDERDQLIHAGRDFIGRATRTTDSEGSAKVVWLVPYHHDAERVAPLRVAIWTPTVAALLLLIMLFVATSSASDGKRS
jgi:hypothetical protein